MRSGSGDSAEPRIAQTGAGLRGDGAVAGCISTTCDT